MSQFTSRCFQTSFLADAKLSTVLSELCVDPDAAKEGDILAVEFPYKMKDGEMFSAGLPGRVITVVNGNTLRLPFYTMISNGLDEKRIRLIAQAFSQMHVNWCLNLGEQMASMIAPDVHKFVPFDLILAPGVGVLLRNTEDDEDEIDPEVLTTDALFQRHIDEHLAVAIAPYTSSHERLSRLEDTKRASLLASRLYAFFHPYKFSIISPTPTLP
jgi:hypothetical protein